MALITTLSGTWTWNGTTAVTSDNTSEVAVGDYVRMDADSPSFEISAISANVSVTILNPNSETIPSGSGASRNDGYKYSEIMDAGDVVKTVTSEEAITEASAPANTKRTLTEEYASATVHPTKKVVVTRTYGDPVNSKSWCRMVGSTITVSNA